MKIVKLMGGMGNQMFQYAFARSLAHTAKDAVYLDLSWFEDVKNEPGVTVRQYELDVFNTHPLFATGEQVRPFLKVRKSRLPGMLRRLLHIPKYRDGKTVPENAYKFQPEFFKMKKDAYYEGYFQSEKYFSSIRDELLREFSIKEPVTGRNEALLDGVKSSESVFLHVRRGDYVSRPSTNAHHGTCSLEYYRQAIRLMLDRVPDPRFFLFSDDIGWVVENLDMSGLDFTAVSGNDGERAFYDLELMKNCKHGIVANSSFSWWGAWLIQNPGKTIIAPEKWINDESIDTADLIPPGWLRI